jgi:GTPase SAR1 family protein
MQNNGYLKVILAGDYGCGKTSFFKRLNKQYPAYLPRLGVDTIVITLCTNVGPVTFRLWDTGGAEKYGVIRDGYYIGSRAAIMFDLTEMYSYDHLDIYLTNIGRVVQNIPSKICLSFTYMKSCNCWQQV